MGFGRSRIQAWTVSGFDDSWRSYTDGSAATLDAAYYQNAFFEWNGSGIVNGYGLSTSDDTFANPAIDYLRTQRLQVLDMDHLGTGDVSAGLDFQDYDNRITYDRLLKLLRWAMGSGSTPYAAEVFMGQAYRLVPRFVRVLPDRPLLTRTQYPDWVIGSALGDRINTGESDDVIAGGGGDDVIDGGPGTNTAVYLGARAGFRVVVRTPGEAIVRDRSGREGKDRVTRIQFLQFADQRVSLASDRIGGTP